MREILNMLATLAIICGLSGFSLSFLMEKTTPVIKSQVLTYVQGPAIKKVFSESSNNAIEDRADFDLPNGKKVTVFPYKQNNKLIGVAIEASGGGYGGPINVIVGFNIDNDSLLGIGIADMKETPGLGTKIADAKFTKQFISQPSSVELQSKGGKINAVSGATISSSGVISAVHNAASTYGELKSAILQHWQ